MGPVRLCDFTSSKMGPLDYAIYLEIDKTWDIGDPLENWANYFWMQDGAP